MGTRLYVGGLPFSTSESELTELFTRFGSVQSARIITDKFTGQSRGFGFVEMNNADDATKAIAGLNGTRVQSRTITVNEARPQEGREGGGGRGGGYGGGGYGGGGRGERSGGGYGR